MCLWVAVGGLEVSEEVSAMFLLVSKVNATWVRGQRHLSMGSEVSTTSMLGVKVGEACLWVSEVNGTCL